MKPLRRALMTVCACAAIAPAWAQLPPGKPIRIVVPYPAGGAADLSIRAVAVRLAQDLGQPVVVENRPGANGNIGADAVATSPGDGLTLLASSNFIAFNPALEPKPRWKSDDLVPVARVAQMHNLVVVPSILPIATMAELVAHARANPGLSAATGGAGNSQTHALDILESVAGVKLTYVEYKGGPPSVPDLVTGLVKMSVYPYSLALPRLADGKLRALAVTSAERSTLAPEIPTTAEAGFPGVVSVSWYGLHAPRSTPGPTIQALEAAVLGAMRAPEVRAQLLKVGAEPAALGTDAFAQFVRDESRRAESFRRTGGAKASGG